MNVQHHRGHYHHEIIIIYYYIIESINIPKFNTPRKYQYSILNVQYNIILS